MLHNQVMSGHPAFARISATIRKARKAGTRASERQASPGPPPIERSSACRYVKIFHESLGLAEAHGMDCAATYRFWFTTPVRGGSNTYHFESMDLETRFDFTEDECPYVEYCAEE